MLTSKRIYKITSKIGTVIALTLVMAACSSNDTTVQTTVTPQATASAPASNDTSPATIELPDASDNASTLAKLEAQWSVDAPDGDQNPCPFSYASIRLDANQTNFPALALIGNHASVTYEESVNGSYGEAKLYLVARDRYVGDTNKSVNYEGYTFEAWLVTVGKAIDAEGSRVATTIAVTGETTLKEAYRKGKLLSRHASLIDANGEITSVTKLQLEEGIAITGVNFSKQTATILNRGDQDVNLTGWSLEGTNKRESYVFSEGTMLKAGAQLTIVAGVTGGKAASAGEIVWDNNRFPWRYDGDQAILRNADKEVVSHFEAPDLTDPVIIGEYTDMPISASVITNQSVKDAIGSYKDALGSSADDLRLSAVKRATASNSRTIWMLMLRPEGQTDGAFADVRIDPDNGELLSVYGLGGASDRVLSNGDPIALKTLANERLRLLLGNAGADYELLDLVDEHGYAKLIVSRGNQDIYQILYSDEDGFTSISRPWLSAWD
ncbi:lamin tail domain-containing protein [Cohnella yongneupensis]|uniref:Lamin tail domain-containing protein n=1 Tax=Cohnella yongneupensis TaxID=425006 RepID=A0ABW0R7R0_9BACL